MENGAAEQGNPKEGEPKDGSGTESDAEQADVQSTPPDDFEPADTFPEDHSWHGRPRCQGWSVQKGRQCLQMPVEGRAYCRFHGGATKTGKDHPGYKHGLYVKNLRSVDMGQKFDELLGDDELISLRKEIALISLQIDDAIGEEDWEKVKQLTDTKRRLVRDEAKRIKDEGHFIPLDAYRRQMRQIVGRILQVVPDSYRDPVIEAVRVEESGQPRQLPSR